MPIQMNGRTIETDSIIKKIWELGNSPSREKLAQFLLSLEENAQVVKDILEFDKEIEFKISNIKALWGNRISTKDIETIHSTKDYDKKIELIEKISAAAYWLYSCFLNSKFIWQEEVDRVLWIEDIEERYKEAETIHLNRIRFLVNKNINYLVEEWRLDEHQKIQLLKISDYEKLSKLINIIWITHQRGIKNEKQIDSFLSNIIKNPTERGKFISKFF